MKNLLFVMIAIFNTPSYSMINGLKVDKGYEAIGSLRPYDVPSGSSCTATLIAADWIVTAEHCTWGGTEEIPEKLRPNQIFFQIGTNSEKPLTSVKLKRWISSPVVKIDGEEIQLDISFAQLAKPIRGITPIAIKIDIIDSIKTYEVVGYGYESPVGYGSLQGTKKMAKYKVTGFSGDPFLNIFKTSENFEHFIQMAFPDEDADMISGDGLPYIDYQVHAWDERGRVNGVFTAQPKGGWSNTCNGDSGGPMLEMTPLGPRVVGIISGGYTGMTLGCVPIGSKISIFGPALRDLYKEIGI